MGSNRVNRGGDWNNNADNCESAYRNNNTPDNRNNNLGFRLALVPAQGKTDVIIEPAYVSRSSTFAGQKRQEFHLK